MSLPVAPDIHIYLTAMRAEYAAGNATEHTHRPALKQLVESIQPGIIATNEPKRVACGAPDFIVTRGTTPLGYIEAKDIGKSLDEAERTDQVRRYRAGLANLILTDYLEFRWYVSGQHRLSARLARITTKGKLQGEKDGPQRVSELLTAFLSTAAPVISSPKDLAQRMAALARLIRTAINHTLDQGGDGALQARFEAFQKVLLRDLTREQFADMYAQTICYGLFAARCNATGSSSFTRKDATFGIPKTNPFLRSVFAEIAGPNLDERIVWVVDDLAGLLNRADVSTILSDFGKRSRREDPVVHFYETFLAEYDPTTREVRGVYYTPEPVVSYIVRSVDYLLRTEFGLRNGLADTATVKVPRLDGTGKADVPKVLILDPATGTGTFLYAVINLIYENFSRDKGLWSSYVSEHLLPRLYGFELLMAPYTVAHMKLSLQLAETGYNFRSEERLRVYLTNTLEEPHELAGYQFIYWLTDEANAASRVKKDAPVMVVLGNPPYSGHSANKGRWITDLLHGYDAATGKKTANYFEVDGQPLGEKNPKWLNDDYVKFIRFAQWRIERTGYGILAFVTNHGYLDNPTFRGMRRSLMDTFDDIYVLDLHGNTKKQERSPDGSKDENVFDIQQGVAIGIFVKRATSKTGLSTVRHADLWGPREGKYEWLSQKDVNTAPWVTLQPGPPFYLFAGQDEERRSEYERGWKVTDIFPLKSVGVVTGRDHVTIHWTKEEVWETVNCFAKLDPEDIRAHLEAGSDAQEWRIASAQQDIIRSGPSWEFVVPIWYRPFDIRYTYYTGSPRGFVGRPRVDVMRHLQEGKNLGIHLCRQTSIPEWAHVLVTRGITDDCYTSNKTSEHGYTFPLYIFSETSEGQLFKTDGSGTSGTDTQSCLSNVATAFTSALEHSVQMRFTRAGKQDLEQSFGPEDVLHYTYAILHSPTYRSRYREFLKIDFPCIPLTSNPALFRDLCRLGGELVALHLMEKSVPAVTNYPIPGNNIVDAVRYTEPSQAAERGRVWINATQYFDGVPPEVWEFHVGSYQVCQKWLKDRKGRQLSYDDLTHYQQVVAALAETIRLMAKVDAVIEEHGAWPIR